MTRHTGASFILTEVLRDDVRERPVRAPVKINDALGRRCIHASCVARYLVVSLSPWQDSSRNADCYAV